MSHRSFARQRLLMVLLVGMLILASCTSASGPTVASATTTTTVEVSYDRSCEKTAQTQTDMDFCAASELKQLQGQLTEALVKERRVLDPALVDTSEGAFERYEIAECDALASPNKGGSIYPLLMATCEVTLTAQRIEQVRSGTAQASQGLDRNP